MGESAPIFDIPLEWSDNSDNETGFRVYRQRMDQEGEELTFAGATGANQPAFTDLDTWCGATYQYTISSFNAAGESPATECWQIALPACPQSNTAALENGLEGGLNFLTNAKGADSDLYWALTTDNQPIFMGDQEGQQGVLDLGDVGETPLYRVTLPGGVTYKRDGVTAQEGHTYASRARDGQSVIIFTVKSTGNPLAVEYIIYTPEEAISSSCEQIALTVPPGLAFSSQDSGGSTTSGSSTGGSTTGGSTTGGTTTGSSTGDSTGTATDGGDTGGTCGFDPTDGICCDGAGETAATDPACAPPPTCGFDPTDGICCDGAGENSLTAPDDCPSHQGGCNDPCSVASDCAGANPVCNAGFCYDAALCDPGTSGGNNGGNNNGGNNNGGNDRGGADTGGSCPCECVAGAAAVCYDCNGNQCSP